MAGNSEFVGKQGWTVGIFEWLNDPSSKVNRYWRLIEQGGGENAGRYLIGLWGPRAGSNFRPNEGLIGGSLDRFGGEGQKFVPFAASEKGNALKAARAALWYFMQGGNGPNMALLRLKPDGKGSDQSQRKNMFHWLMALAPLEKIPFVQGRIGGRGDPRHIAHRHYERAVNSIQPVARELEILAQRLGVAIGSVGMEEEEIRTARLAPGLARIAASSTVKYRNLKGQWMTNIIREVNIQVATEVQEEVVALMTADAYLRPRTNDLVEATQDPRNRYPR